MRLAVLADIHGNLPAFEAALADVAKHTPDQVIIGGDVAIGSPDTAACWQLAKSLGCPILRGNHERYAAHFGTPLAAPDWSTAKFTPLHWAVSQLSAAERLEMGSLSTTIRLPEAPDLLLVHASARGDHDTITAHTSDDQLQAMFAGVQERYLVRSHNHVGFVRLWGPRLVISNSSVGLALDGNPTAQYLLLDQTKEGWAFQHRSAPYDLDATIRRFHETGYLAETGPMGQLFLREVVTATQQIVPFLRLYAGWSKQGPCSLDEAFKRFLSRF